VNYKALLEHGFEKRVRVFRAALASSLPSTQVFAQANGSTTVGEAVAKLDAFLALGRAADLAEQQLKSARMALLAATPAAHDFHEQLRGLVAAYHGATNPVLANFGIQPKKRRKLKVLEEAAAAVRRGNTRKIRGTLGPKQKLKLKSGPVSLRQVVPSSDPGDPGEPEGS
jgi:hypothetical protein